MPGFDGIGPRETGPLSGGGRGYCVLRLPAPGSNEAATGYAGIQGAPVRVALPSVGQGVPISLASLPYPRLGRRGGRRGRIGYW